MARPSMTFFLTHYSQTRSSAPRGTYLPQVIKWCLYFSRGSLLVSSMHFIQRINCHNPSFYQEENKAYQSHQREEEPWGHVVCGSQVAFGQVGPHWAAQVQSSETSPQKDCAGAADLGTTRVCKTPDRPHSRNREWSRHWISFAPQPIWPWWTQVLSHQIRTC